MSQKSIREIHGKQMLQRWFAEKCAEVPIPKNMLLVDPTTNLDSLPQQFPWLLNSKLVAKPDQLIKRRGNSKLIHLNGDWTSTKQWIEQHRGKSQQIEKVKGDLTHFLIEEFVPHVSSQEMYVCISSVRQGSLVYYCREGGVDVGDVDAKAEKYLVPIDQSLTEQTVQTNLLKDHIKDQQERKLLSHFIVSLFHFYTELHFAYLEINPIVVREGRVFPLDFAAKVDQTADFLCSEKWGKIDFPPPFGRAQTKEEAFIAELDAKTGASLKLTVLNPNGRIWTMVAGGGASVVYADTISDLGFGEELANYGEYSGDPSEALTFQYAKTVLELMTKSKHPKGNKILVIGGGIANFTNVAETFGGIVRAITLLQEKLRETNVKIYVRRGGPNYQEGLQRMRECGESCGIHMEVFGPETHITSIIPYALGLRSSPLVGTYDSTSTVPTTRMSPASPPPMPPQSSHTQQSTPDRPSKRQKTSNGTPASSGNTTTTTTTTTSSSRPAWSLLSDSSQAFVWGMQPGAVQNMLDFDHVCGRSTPSVVAMIYPFSGNHFQKFYWGAQEVLIPVYEKTAEAMQRHPHADVLINFASFRSVYSSTAEALAFPQLKTIAIIAEGVPEQQTKSLIRIARSRNITIIGPATVGGIKPGCFRIGNTGGMIDNIIASKLYRAGSVAYVSRSGGMSNELNNIVSRNSDGVCEGIAIGGDRFPGTTFLDHLLRYEQDPDVKIMVLLGEVGGIEEYDICEAIKQKKITKPLIAWCIGTCAKIFPYEVQFGHAGALAHGNLETAQAKNEAMRNAGAHVPKSFDDFGTTIRSVYTDLVNKKIIIERPEPAVPTVPMDYSWARKLGLIRKPTSFVSTISDERGDELLYAGVPISSILKENLGVGGVISLLWFKRRLPSYATKFIEMVLIVTADHGPAVSGAHNTIITARAGKDLISSMVSGLVTIGPRFGGAIDGAAQQFSEAFDLGKKPKQFVEEMKNENKLIMGIGHRIKSADHADSRVKLLKEFIMTQFPTHPVLDYALEVEKITTAKKSNLILNLDGVIGTSFVDLLRGCGAFTQDEVKQYLEAGCLNALFVVGRSIGLVGHYIDQVRLKQPLYRHPWDDISYQDENQNA